MSSTGLPEYPKTMFVALFPMLNIKLSKSRKDGNQ